MAGLADAIGPIHRQGHGDEHPPRPSRNSAESTGAPTVALAAA